MLTAVSIGVFLFGTLFLGYLLYGAARTLAASIPMQSGIPLPAIIASRQPGAGDSAPASANEPQPQVQYQQQERINFLLMGIDLRPGEYGPARTDTLIIVTHDASLASKAERVLHLSDGVLHAGATP